MMSDFQSKDLVSSSKNVLTSQIVETLDISINHKESIMLYSYKDIFKWNYLSCHLIIKIKKI